MDRLMADAGCPVADPACASGRVETARAPRLGDVAFVAHRPIELAGFYQELLGLELVRTTDNERGGRTELLSAAPGEEDHELVLLSRPQAAHVALRALSAVDLARLHDRLREHDVPIIEELDVGRALSVFLRDPEGNLVELYCATWSCAPG